MRHITKNIKSLSDLALEMRDRMCEYLDDEWPDMELPVAEEILVENGIYDEQLAQQLADEWSNLI